MSMEMMRPDLIDMSVQTAEQVTRRAIARRLMEDATTILAEGDRVAKLMGMDVIVTENLPEDVGLIVHPRQWAFIVSSITMQDALIFNNQNT